MWQFLAAALVDESKHFALACCLGWLAYWLTWTILRAWLSALHRGTPPRVSTAAGCGIRLCCLLLACAAALASHWLLDLR